MRCIEFMQMQGKLTRCCCATAFFNNWKIILICGQCNHLNRSDWYSVYKNILNTNIQKKHGKPFGYLPAPARAAVYIVVTRRCTSNFHPSARWRVPLPPLLLGLSPYLKDSRPDRQARRTLWEMVPINLFANS